MLSKSFINYLGQNAQVHIWGALVTHEGIIMDKINK